jgi:transcriptional regulator with XRE-family HTH domain
VILVVLRVYFIFILFSYKNTETSYRLSLWRKRDNEIHSLSKFFRTHMSTPTERFKQARKNANLSQSDLARELDVSQAQISKYEQNPGAVTYNTIRQLERLLGIQFEDLFKEDDLFVENDDWQGLPIENPYSSLRKRLSLLRQYAESSPISDADFTSFIDQNWDDLPTPDRLKNQVDRLRHKPNVVLSGKFDSGKSHFCNYLLGGKHLPVGYQPKTKVVTIVRHIDDKPDWQTEEVWLLGEGLWRNQEDDDFSFDLSVLDNRNRVEEHRLYAGTLELLPKHGIHRGNGGSMNAHTAVVYLDAPVLEGCNLIDLPGYSSEPDNQNRDTVLALNAIGTADIMIYMSPYNTHLDGEDFIRLQQALRILPHPETIDGNEAFPTYGNLFVVTTHANPTSVDDSELKDLQNTAADRLYGQLRETVLENYKEETGRSISPEHLHERFFSFWSEDAGRCEKLRDALTALLQNQWPRTQTLRLQQVVQSIKASSTAEVNRRIENFQSVLKDIDAAKERLAELQSLRPKHKEKVEKRRKSLRHKIEQQRQNSKIQFKRDAKRLLTNQSVEDLIRKHYSEKKEAQEYAPALLADRIEQLLEDGLKEFSNPLKQDFEAFLSLYDDAFAEVPNQHGNTVEIEFDARGAFAGGLVGVGVLGALGIWAGAVGSNLGGYILVAKGVSLLSSLGLYSGGVSAAISAVAAIGGPITLAIGIAAAAGITAWRLMRKSWQERLAKKLIGLFEEQNVVAKYEEGIDKFWDATLDAFMKGADEVEQQFDNRINNLRALTSDKVNSKERIEELLGKLKALRDFFAGLPWATVQTNGSLTSLVS